MMIYETLVLASVALIAPVFGKFAGYELRRKPFEFVASSGLFFMLSVAFALLPLQESMLTSIWNFLGIVSYFIAWITMVVGVIWQLFEVITIPEAKEHV